MIILFKVKVNSFLLLLFLTVNNFYQEISATEHSVTVTWLNMRVPRHYQILYRLLGGQSLSTIRSDDDYSSQRDKGSENARHHQTSLASAPKLQLHSGGSPAAPVSANGPVSSRTGGVVRKIPGGVAKAAEQWNTADIGAFVHTFTANGLKATARYRFCVRLKPRTVRFRI